MSRKRDYNWVWNNYPEDWEKSVNSMYEENTDKIRFVGAGLECVSTPHIQGYIYCHTVQSIKGLQKLFQRYGIKCAITEIHSKLHSKNSQEYFKKDGNYKTWGDLPQQGKRTDLVEFMDTVDSQPLIPEIKLMREFPTVMAKYASFALKYRLLAHQPEIMNYDETPHEWHWGPPGVGKSRRFQEMPRVFRKMPNHWWTGYDPAEHDLVLLEDLDSTHRKLAYYLKIWLDRYPFMAQVHFGTVNIRPQKVVITSNFHPSEIFCPGEPPSPEDQLTYEAIHRRIKIFHHQPEVTPLY